MQYVVIVEFQLKQGTRAEFRRLIDVNAQASVQNEEGCLQFDVLEPQGEDDQVVLYEIYSSKAAFEAHHLTDHFRAFASANGPLCLHKSIIHCNLVFAGTPPASKV